MRPLIMKFGGTSVADAAAISGAVRLVRSAVASGDPAVVVVSAMSGVTDELLRACELARTGNISAAEAAVDSVAAADRHGGLRLEQQRRLGSRYRPARWTAAKRPIHQD